MNTEMKNEKEILQKEEASIDLIEIALSVLGKLWLILLVALICGSIAWVYIDSTYVPSYSSYGSIYLVVREPEENIHIGDVSYASTMMEDYVYCIKQEENMKDALARIPTELRLIYGNSLPQAELEDYIDRTMRGMSWQSLRGATTISVAGDTHYLELSVVSTDPILSNAAANAVLYASRSRLEAMFGVDIEQMIISQYPSKGVLSSSKPIKYALLAALIGALLIIAILVFLYLQDDKINTSDDVEKYLGLPVLGIIPAYESLATKDESHPKKEHAT